MSGAFHGLKFSKRVFRTAATLCFGVALAFLCAASAADQCEPLESETESACNNPNDTVTGDESGQMTRLAEELRTAGRNTGSIGYNQANQCQNQQRVQELARQLAQLKASACENLIAKCAETCEREAQENDAKAQQVQLLNPGLAQQFREIARRKRDVRKRCEENEGNVAAALTQAAQNADRANINAQCNQLAAQELPQMGDSGSSQPPQATPTPPLSCHDPSNARNPNCPRSGLSTSAGEANLTASGAGGESVGSAGSSSYRDPASSYVEGGQSGSSQTSGYASGGGSGASGGISVGSATGSSSSEKAETPETSVGAYAKKNALSADGSGGGGGGRGGGGRGDDTPDPLLLGKFKQKKLGGMTVQAVDGITGPMGASLFEKVSQQYKRQMPNFLQD